MEVIKGWDLEYVGMCFPEECYRRLPHVCAWLHDSEVKVRPQGDPIGVKRKMLDLGNKSDADEGPNKKIREEGIYNRITLEKRVKCRVQKAKLRKQKKTVRALK